MASDIPASTAPGQEDIHDMIESMARRLYVWANPALASLHHDPPTWSYPFAKAEHALLTAAAYLLFVIFGTMLMKQASKPVNVQALKYIYNPIQVILCSWMCLEAGRQVYKLEDGKLIGNSFKPDRTALADVLWWFYVSKILDFMDTVFIILGQKWAQLSFLHVYHHTSIFLTYWIIINAGYDGDIYLTIVLNTFVHTCMYLYYMITALGLYEVVDKTTKGLYFKRGSNYELIAGSNNGDVRKRVYAAKYYSPSWKWMVTYLQMAQFILMNLQALYCMYFPVEYPFRISCFYLVYIQSLFWLFDNFRRNAYKKNKATKRH